MASEQELMEALKRADAAGATADAKVLAGAIMQMRKRPPQGGSIVDPIGQGVSLGFSDEIAGALGAIPASLQTGNSIPDAYRGIRDAARDNQAAFRERNPGTAIVSEIGGGLLTGGLGAGSLAGQTGKQLLRGGALLGAKMGGASGLGHSEADTAGGMAKDTAIGAGIGAAAGYAFPAIGQKLSQFKSNILAGRSTDPYKQAVNVLEKAGVDLSTGQKTGANWVKATEKTLQDVPIGGKPLQTVFENQQKQYQAKLFEQLGVKADMLTQESLDKVRAHLSGEYAKALAGKTVSLESDDFLNQLATIEAKHTQFVDDPTKKAVRRIVGDFLDEIINKGGGKTGEWYQGQRSVFAQKAKTPGPLSEMYGELKSALDDAFTAAAGPVKGSLDAKYAQFKQLQTMYDAVRGGAAGAEGFIPAGQLAKLAAKSPGTKEWKELTRAAATVIPDRLGNSGTAQRQYILNALGLGGMALDPVSTASAVGASRLLSGQMAAGKVPDVTALVPNGNLLMGQGAAPSALSGLLLPDAQPNGR